MTTIHNNKDKSRSVPGHIHGTSRKDKKLETNLERISRIAFEQKQSENSPDLISLSDEKFDEIVEDAMREELQHMEAEECLSEEEYKSNILEL